MQAAICAHLYLLLSVSLFSVNELNPMSTSETIMFPLSRLLSLFLFIISNLLLLNAPSTVADTPLNASCTGDSYSFNSSFAANLEILLSSLSSWSFSTTSNYTTSGANPDRAYGLYLCTGELSHTNCHSCIQTAVADVVTRCAASRRGIIWYDKCLLRYSDQKLFGVVDNEGQALCSPTQPPQDAANATAAIVSRLASVAANSPSMFAADEAVIDSLSSYFLVQCTRDLSSESCKNCFERGTSKVASSCSQSRGWRYLSGSCTMRYETFPFFNQSVVASGTPGPLPPPTREEGGSKKKPSTVRIITIVALIVGGAVLLSLCFYILRLCIQNRSLRLRHFCSPIYCFIRIARRQNSIWPDYLGPLPHASELLFMDLASLRAATSNFSEEYKLGEGGFGPVYKGTLGDGREVAVKRLSTTSNQGAAKFQNEVELIAKLHHRNLVRILGCCAEREEKLLIYEYLPNKNLDAFLFVSDADKRSQLDWSRRLRIIEGIASGLAYLHDYSGLKVIHRDLKASNILLDNEMNPKISDFDMAKIFKAEETEANTARVGGTYGYMAPEYATCGIFSEKSDVYSFGVLLLEIFSGQRNSHLHFEQHGQTLPRRARGLRNEDEAMEFMDPLLGQSYPSNEATRCIQLGLLCVQENAEERPTMATINLTLQSQHLSPSCAKIVMIGPQYSQPVMSLGPMTSNLEPKISRKRKLKKALMAIGKKVGRF